MRANLYGGFSGAVILKGLPFVYVLSRNNSREYTVCAYADFPLSYRKFLEGIDIFRIFAPRKMVVALQR